jgi:hypothetical protein
MASGYQTLDTNSILLRNIYAKYPSNGTIPSRYILIADGAGGTNWDSVSSITPLGYTAVVDPSGNKMYAGEVGNELRVSTVGVGGLFGASVDFVTSTFTLSNGTPNLLVGQTSVPAVSRIAASIVPSPENIFYSTTQSTLKFLGVGDLQLSTVADLRAVFFSISSFSAKGYADLSAETRAWRPYVYSTNSTSAGYATFISSLPVSSLFTSPYGPEGWDWASSLGTGLRLSTVEAYPNYTSGDALFSTVSFNMAPFMRYIHPNSTTKMFLEMQPNYFFPRMFLGTSTPYTLMKEFSTFVEYQSPLYGRQILGSAVHGGYMTSQQSNAYASNYFNSPLKLELDTAALASNYLRDAYHANYTVYHRIPGAMAALSNDGYCDYLIGTRGGFSNATPTYDNMTSRSNAVFLHVYNQQGAAPPMPGP